MTNIIRFENSNAYKLSLKEQKIQKGIKPIALANMCLTPLEFSIKVSRLSFRGGDKHIELLITMMQEARDSWVYFTDKHFHFHLDTLLKYQEYVDE